MDAPETKSTRFSTVPCLGLSLRILWRLALLALAVFLLKHTLKVSGSDLQRDLTNAQMAFLLTAFFLYGFIQVLGAWRWNLLMAVQQMKLPWFHAFRLTMIGIFFSTLIPGSVSGDLLKIGFATRNFPGRATEIAGTILLDRFQGLFGLFLAAMLATPLLLHQIAGFRQDQPLLMSAVLLANVGCLLCMILFALYWKKERLLKNKSVEKSAHFLGKFLPSFAVKPLQRFQDALDLYRSTPNVLLCHLSCSVFIHFLNAAVLFAIGKALGERVMTLTQYTLSAQIANATGILPLTPGGIGMRDAVTAAFFQAFHATPADIGGSIPVIFSIIIVFWGILGALVYTLSPASTNRSVK